MTPTAAGGQADLSFIDRIRVTYPRSYRAQDDSLNFSIGANTALVKGFSTSATRVVDITQPNSLRELAPKISRVGESYEFWISGTGSAGATRNLIAIADTLVGQPLSVSADQPSDLTALLADVDMVIISHGDLRQSVEPLAAWRRTQGLKVAVVDIEEVYDEFSYGSHTPEALRDLLAWTASHSVKPPRCVLLVGDSSWDPRKSGPGLPRLRAHQDDRHL